MKSTHKTQIFDYNKVEQKQNPMEWWEYFGIHSKSGKIHVNTKRFKKILVLEVAKKFLKEGMLKNRTTSYLIPKQKHRYDYKVNIMRDLLSNLQREWNQEYKVLLNIVKTSKDVYESERFDSITMTSCSEDIDEIEAEALFESFKRQPKYELIIQSLYCQFISKICTEVDRYTLIFITELGYSQKDFSMRDFRSFTDGLKHETKANLINTLKGFNAFNMLHKINNFLKHNTIEAYNGLKKEYPNNVKNVIGNSHYKNGMFAGDWIVLKNGYIDNIFQKLIDFFEDYCSTFLNEDLEESNWNYDDYFKDVFRKIKSFDHYLGVDY